MKIGVITHPFSINYGGILQAYALQSFLEGRGHDVVYFDKTPTRPWYKLPLDVWRERGKSRWHPNFASFIDRYIHISPRLRTYRSLNKFCTDQRIELLVTGSDQVWRESFVRSRGFFYFLDFRGKVVKRVSYAASFVLDQWGYSEEETTYIRQCLNNFNKVSVREQSAVGLLKTHVGIDVQVMPDPTMLLTPSEYDGMASERLIDEPYIFVYWLGNRSNMEEAIRRNNPQGQQVRIVSLRDKQSLVSIPDWIS